MKKRHVIVPALVLSFFILFRSFPGKAKWYDKTLEDIYKGIRVSETALKAVVESAAQLATRPFRKQIKKEQYPISKNPYKKTVATVRRGGPVSPEEQAYLKRRRLVNRVAMERFIGFALPADVPMPDVYISLSGGGDRAALLTWGFLRALQQIGLFDAATYMSTLSGSGWCVWPWLASGSTLQEHKERLLSSVISGPVLRSPDHIKGIVDVMLRDLAYKRPINFATLYGAILGSIFMHGLGEYNDPQMVWMQMVQDTMKDATVPYPMLTMISVPDARWFSVTPHEFGSAALSAFIPEWAANRRFSNGSSVGAVPYADRVTLSRWMGDSSLAPGASFGNLFDKIFAQMKEGPVKDLLQILLKESPLKGIRFIYSERFNFAKGLPDLPMYDLLDNKTWADARRVKYTDAGVIWGNPVVPFLERIALNETPAILLMMDASAIVGQKELSAIKDFALGNNADQKILPFPNLPVDTQILKTKAVSALADKKMLVLYFPRIIDQELLAQNKENPDFKALAEKLSYNMEDRVKINAVYSTFNTKYSRKAAEDLVALSQFNVLASVEKIRRTIQDYILKYLDRVRPEHAQQVRQRLNIA